MRTQNHAITWPRLDLPPRQSYLYDHKFRPTLQTAPLEGGYRTERVLATHILSMALDDLAGLSTSDIVLTLENHHGAALRDLSSFAAREHWIKDMASYPYKALEPIFFRISNPSPVERRFSLTLYTRETLEEIR